ncbi:MAG: nitroreductase family protein [Candidatus Pacearchaeota archaeon]|nr:nitroreductase family protein [Candidatus Pacearchaeota archaeon]
MDFDKVLRERKSIRNYSAKTAKFEDIIDICEAARFAPMAGNIYTIRLILVTDKEKKKQLAEAALEQEFISDASCVIVVCSDLTQLVRSYGNRALIYSRQQAGAVIENMLLKITELGLGACWIGAFEENAIKRILNIPDSIQIEALIPIGNPLGKTQAKKKPELKFILYFEKWNQTTAKPIKKAPA